MAKTLKKWFLNKPKIEFTHIFSPSNCLDMHNQNSIFELLFRIFLNNQFTPKKANEKDNHAQNVAMLAALGMLAFVGFDAIKVVFRNDFGSRGFNLFRVILAALAFLILSGVGLHLATSDTYIDPVVGSRFTFALAGIFYMTAAFYLLVLGFKKKKISRQNQFIHPDYEGDSSLLGFLVKEKGWKQINVQLIAEPVLVLSIGITLSLVNLLWGLPLVVCALSVWGSIVVNFIFGVNPVENKLINKGYRPTEDGFTYTQN